MRFLLDENVSFRVAVPTARAYDAMIAATAMSRDLPVYTCNPSDFLAIDGLTVVAITVPADSSGDRPGRTSVPEIA
jgi:hypothetical protein